MGGFTESVFAERLLSNRAIFFKFWHSNLVVTSDKLWNSCQKSNIQFWELPKRGKSEFRDPEKGPKTPNKVEIVYNMAKIRWNKHIDPLWKSLHLIFQRKRNFVKRQIKRDRFNYTPAQWVTSVPHTKILSTVYWPFVQQTVSSRIKNNLLTSTSSIKFLRSNPTCESKYCITIHSTAILIIHTTHVLCVLMFCVFYFN